MENLSFLTYLNSLYNYFNNFNKNISDNALSQSVHYPYNADFMNTFFDDYDIPHFVSNTLGIPVNLKESLEKMILLMSDFREEFYFNFYAHNFETLKSHPQYKIICTQAIIVAVDMLSLFKENGFLPLSNTRDEIKC